MDPLDALESSLSWSEFWATLACGAVALGLVIEYKSEFAKAFKERRIGLVPLGALLVTAGVAAEFMFQLRTSVLISSVRGIQHNRDSEQRTIIADTLERAAKAELELAKLKSPRTIKPEQANNLIANLSRYRGKRFWIIIDKSEIDVGSEQETLGRQLTEIFLQAQWIKDSHTMKDRSKIDPESTPVSNRGCVVSTADDPSSVNLAKVVLDGLKSAGVECGAPGPFPEMASEMVAIEIGLR